LLDARGEYASDRAGRYPARISHIRRAEYNLRWQFAAWQILIPPGVAHGYKVVGTGPSLLIYATDRFYNPADEGRIPYNDPSLNYDWELQHK